MLRAGIVSLTNGIHQYNPESAREITPESLTENYLQLCQRTSALIDKAEHLSHVLRDVLDLSRMAPRSREYVRARKTYLTFLSEAESELNEIRNAHAGPLKCD